MMFQMAVVVRSACLMILLLNTVLSLDLGHGESPLQLNINWISFDLEAREQNLKFSSNNVKPGTISH